jgi:hypothetical protein
MDINGNPYNGRPLVGTEPNYPTPWRLAEVRNDGEIYVVAEPGHQAFSAEPRLASFLVDLVEWFVHSGMTEAELSAWASDRRDKRFEALEAARVAREASE